MKKLYLLLCVQYFLFSLRAIIFIKNIPLDLPRAEMMVGGVNRNLLIVTALYLLCFYQLKQKKKGGYIFSWGLSCLWILSVFSYSFYFHLAELVTMPYIVLNFVFLIVCFLSMSVLLNEEVKENFIVKKEK